MKLRTRQHTQEPARQAEAPVVAPALQKAAHALPDAFRAQTQAPSVRGLAAMVSVAAGATAVPDYDQPTVDLGAEPPVRQVDTPEFKAWFGASMVVDEAGNPLRCFHGTTAKDLFTVFQPSRGVGRNGWIFLSLEPEEASEYTNSSYGEAPEYPDGARVLPCYVKALAIFDGANADHVRRVGIPHLAGGYWMGLEGYAKEIQSAGFDGAWVREYEGSELAYDIAVFSSLQIKSAIGNSGAFDPTDPDITK